MLTKEQCDLIVEKSDAFYRKETIVNGCDVHIYNYRLASWSDFNDPLGDGNTNAFDLRGLTFVKEDGLWKRWVTLHKFFNYNETISYMRDDLISLEISHIDTKHDGSLIQFILVDGKWCAKSKTSFDSAQAERANKLFSKNKELRDFVKSEYAQGRTALFELTSPYNRIVLQYKRCSLNYLCSRDLETGLYTNTNINLVHELGLEKRPQTEHQLNRLECLQELVENEEGWIVTFSNGQIVKFKTRWYFQMHKAKDDLMTNNVTLLELVLDELLDDSLALFEPDNEFRVELERKAKMIRDYYNHNLAEVESFVNDYLTGKYGSRKEFAIQNSKHKYFNVACQLLFNDNVNDASVKLKEAIKKRYNKHEKVEVLFCG